MCSDDGPHLVNGTFHKDYILEFNRFHYRNKVLFIMVYDFECMITDGKQIPDAFGLFIKNDYPDILDNKV